MFAGRVRALLLVRELCTMTRQGLALTCEGRPRRSSACPAAQRRFTVDARGRCI
jgi:hypothetical protein